MNHLDAIGALIADRDASEVTQSDDVKALIAELQRARYLAALSIQRRAAGGFGETGGGPR